MSKVKILPSSLKGTVTAPPSKSAAHRALICSFLSGGGSVKPIIDSNDMRATIGVLDGLKNDSAILNCIESGSTLRFMLPVAAALGKSVTFTGEGRLPQRPIGEYLDLLPKFGVSMECDNGLPLSISGKLKNGTYEVSGDVSSQYITGLLLALSILEGDSAIVLKTPLQSKPYVDMTVKVMADFGVNVFETDFGYLIHGGQTYKKLDYIVEGDWSQAAFFLVAGAICGEVTVSGLDINSTQGDRYITEVLRAFGADVSVGENSVTVKHSRLTAANIDATDIPDLVPIIAVLAANANGKTIISGAGRLRYKESDRLQSVCENLKLLGIEVTENEDGLEIVGGQMHGSCLKGYNDHRIVMAFAVAGLVSQGEVIIDDCESINKSYPSFFEDYNKLGGRANVL